MGLFGFGRREPSDVAFTPAIIKEFGENAVQIAKEELNIDLDFSPESLSTLDKAITTHFPDPTEQKASGEKQMQFVFAFGSYVGETLRRNLHGQWDITPFKQNEFPYALMEKVAMNVGPLKVFPFEKTWKRFAYGEEDSLASFYIMCSEVSNRNS